MHDELNSTTADEVSTTADEVSTAWAEIADGCDPTEADEQATTLLRNAVAHDSVVEYAIENIKLVAQTEGVSLEEIGYTFCLERKIWRCGIEAVLQARALQQILRWSVLAPGDRSALRHIVVRYTFYARLDFAPPSLRRSRRVNFIVVPFAYQELLFLAAAALSQMNYLVGVNDTWSCFVRLDQVPRRSADDIEAPPAFRKLIARVITSTAFDTQSTAEEPVSLLARTVGWFSCIGESRSSTISEAALVYSAQDFALAHEIGHCLCPAGTNAYLDSEQAADAAGWRLFAASWGWRDEIFDECPLGQGARVLLGPIFFFFTAGLLFDVRRLLVERVTRALDINTEFLTDSQDMLHLEYLSQRWSSVRQYLVFYVNEIKKLAGPFAVDDERKIDNFIYTLQCMSSAVNSWIASFPDDDLVSAVRFVHPSIAPAG